MSIRLAEGNDLKENFVYLWVATQCIRVFWEDPKRCELLQGGKLVCTHLFGGNKL